MNTMTVYNPPQKNQNKHKHTIRRVTSHQVGNYKEISIDIKLIDICGEENVVKHILIYKIQ